MISRPYILFIKCVTECQNYFCKFQLRLQFPQSMIDEENVQIDNIIQPIVSITNAYWVFKNRFLKQKSFFNFKLIGLTFLANNVIYHI
jgi:hypothetical protein